jgi:metal-responsive CopG/Arc/MetJ family transcriptional regulator
MDESRWSVSKITVSLPQELVMYIDASATERQISRSRVIAEILAEKKAADEDQLAAEGYRFYAEEASDFAADSLPAIAEVMPHDG